MGCSCLNLLHFGSLLEPWNPNIFRGASLACNLVGEKMADNLDYLEESDGSGGSIGLEVEKPEDEIDVPFDPKLIDITTERKTVDLILKRLKAGELDLSPDFQRRGNLWKESVKS